MVVGELRSRGRVSKRQAVLGRVPSFCLRHRSIRPLAPLSAPRSAPEAARQPGAGRLSAALDRAEIGSVRPRRATFCRRGAAFRARADAPGLGSGAARGAQGSNEAPAEIGAAHRHVPAAVTVARRPLAREIFRLDSILARSTVAPSSRKRLAFAGALSRSRFGAERPRWDRDPRSAPWLSPPSRVEHPLPRPRRPAARSSETTAP